MNMYFVAIVLPENLNEQVLKLKHWVQDAWGCKVGLKSPAHITIVPPFWMADELEPDFISDLDALSRPLPSFELATNNFDAFQPRTIFIAVAQSKPLQEVKKASDNFWRQRPQYKVKIEDRPFHPHITIATRDLQKRHFAEAWPQFQQKQFTETFTAQGLSLLRHNKTNWDVIHTSSFQSL